MTKSQNLSATLLMVAFGMILSSAARCEDDYIPANLGGTVGASGLPSLPPRTADQLSNFNKKAPSAADLARLKVYNLLQTTRDLVEAKKYQDALVKLQEVESVPNKTDEETYVVERTRIAIASGLGDDKMLALALEPVIANDRLPAEDRTKFVQALAILYYQQKDYPKAITWTSRSLKEDSTDPDMQSRLIHAYYFNNEFTAAARELRVVIAAEEAAGKAPSQAQLSMLTSSELKSNNHAGYINAVEKSIAYYPKKGEWTELLSNVMSKPGFNDSLSLDVYRLMFKTGQLSTADDYTGMAKLALQGGFPTEARQVLSEGFKNGVLGSGAGASEHKQLLTLATQRSASKPKTLAKEEASLLKAKDGDGLVQIGYVYVTDGQFDKGISLMEKGIQIGGMKRPEHAKLHLGIAQALAGHNSDAIQTLKSVQGTDGAADLARYWTIRLVRPNA